MNIKTIIVISDNQGTAEEVWTKFENITGEARHSSLTTLIADVAYYHQMYEIMKI